MPMPMPPSPAAAATVAGATVAGAAATLAGGEAWLLRLGKVPCDAGCAPVRPPYDADVASPRIYEDDDGGGGDDSDDDDDDDDDDMMGGGGRRGRSTHALLRDNFDYAAFR